MKCQKLLTPACNESRVYLLLGKFLGECKKKKKWGKVERNKKCRKIKIYLKYINYFFNILL